MKYPAFCTIMRKLLRVIHIAILFVACQAPTSQSSQVFRFNMESALTSLDPAFARDQVRIWACNQFFNGLVELDSNMEIVPSLAASWKVSEDGKTYTFTLKDSVFFHPDPCFGVQKTRKLKAEDFQFSFGRIIDEATASPGAWVFQGKVKGKESFKALNDSIFVIELMEAYPPFLGLLSMPYCYVIPKEAVAFYGDEFRVHPVGTGPFILNYWEEGVKLVAVKNGSYFEKEGEVQLPYIDGFEVTFIENKQNAFLEFVQGRLDFLNGLEGSYKDELLTKDGSLRPKYQDRFTLHVGPYLNTEYFGFMLDSAILGEKNPLLDRDLRKALSFAVNREEMIRFLRNGIGIPGNGGFIPKGLGGHDSNVGYAYNLDSAKFYLKRSRYKSEPITIYTNKNYLDLTVYVQKKWQELGVQVKVEVNPGPFHREMVSKGQLMCFRGSWLADYPDAENYLSLFYSPNKAPAGPNYTRFQSVSYDMLMQKAMQTRDEPSRIEYYRQLDSITMAEAPVVILYYDQSVHLLSNQIKRISFNALNNLQIKTIQLHDHPRQ